ncbi:MAG: hypothetical protein IKT81_03135, partial [Clostridia bacterium]|nr:hypothetical protein [Clostridia bacterium]
MNESLKKYIVTTPADNKLPIMQYGSFVQMIYRINELGILQRIPNYSAQGRNIMGIEDRTGLNSADIDRIFRDITNEMNRRSYSGVLLNIRLDNLDIDKAEKLCSLLSQRKILHFLPVELAQLSKDAKIIVPSSVSGGSVADMIKTVTDKYTPSRTCIEIIKCCHDFEMPAYKPEGTMLTKEAMHNLMEQYSPQCFFSSDLGCKYFTYRQDGKVHFVLFDDPETAAYKINLAQSAGLFGVFLLYSEWGENINQILSNSR